LGVTLGDAIVFKISCCHWWGKSGINVEQLNNESGMN